MINPLHIYYLLYYSLPPINSNFPKKTNKKMTRKIYYFRMWYQPTLSASKTIFSTIFFINSTIHHFRYWNCINSYYTNNLLLIITKINFSKYILNPSKVRSFIWMKRRVSKLKNINDNSLPYNITNNHSSLIYYIL